MKNVLMKITMNRTEINIAQFFASPLMQVQLDLDLEKLTEFAFQMQNKDKKGSHQTNRGGWQSNDVSEEKHEEFIRLKKEINQYLRTYHLEVFRGMIFKENIIQDLGRMWVNINEKHHYNEWHIHPFSTLSGTYYIKHDDSEGNGIIQFKNPTGSYVINSHFPPELVEQSNMTTTEIISIIPKSNGILIFPAWLEHRVGVNLKNDSRISLSFNSTPILEKKS